VHDRIVALRALVQIMDKGTLTCRRAG